MAKRRKVGNILALPLLALLVPGHPMHPYQMANVLRRTGKERDMRIKIGSLYTVVQNLERHGFIKAAGSHREGNRPERTTYTITDEGRAELRDWLRELVTESEPDYPRFQAALSVLSALHPHEAAVLLEQRVRALDDDIATRRAALEQGDRPVRLFLIEGEYALAMREAEAAWVRSLLAEITEGTFPDLASWRDVHETGRAGPDFTKLLAEEGGTPTR